MTKLIKIRLTLFFLFASTLCFAQTKEDLEKKRERIITEIRETTRQLERNNKNKKSALIDLDLSTKKIDQQNALLKLIKQNIAEEEENVDKVKKDIENISDIILQKEEELEKSKNSYAKLIYQTYIWKNAYNEIHFLISSKDLNQLYKRKKYLRQISSDRKNQIIKIRKSTEVLNQKREILSLKKDTLEIKKIIEEKLLSDQKNEKIKIEKEKKRNDEIINKIKQNEQFFRDQIEKKKQESKEIESQIKKIIEEEIRLSSKKNNTAFPLTPESLEVSLGFENNKGNLDWPLEKGIITQYYGKQKHKIISGVETVNNGIDFSTEQGQICRSVFEGEIARIFFIKGKGKAVLISHGKYFSVYSGLKEVVVKKGQKVIAKEKLGTVVTSESDQQTILHFEIWKGKDTQNPLKWIYNAD